MGYSHFWYRSIIFSKPLNGKIEEDKEEKSEREQWGCYVAEMMFSWVAFEKLKVTREIFLIFLSIYNLHHARWFVSQFDFSKDMWGPIIKKTNNLLLKVLASLCTTAVRAILQPSDCSRVLLCVPLVWGLPSGPENSEDGPSWAEAFAYLGVIVSVRSAKFPK